MPKRIQALFAPAEYANLRKQDLASTSCVVFDILRATSTMLTALANGATEIIPVAEIDQALALRKSDREILLAGERGGLLIEGFNLGNSPREFTKAAVERRRIAITTTNGTRALRAAAEASEIHIGAFLNLQALAKELLASPNPDILLICAGTGEEAALEDTLAAGALAGLLEGCHLADSARIALATYNAHRADLHGAFALARNGQKLLSIPDLRDDVAFCLQRDTLAFTARLHRDGAIRRS